MASVKNGLSLILSSNVLLLVISPSSGNLIKTKCPNFDTLERNIRTVFLNCATTELYHCLPTTTKGVNKELCMKPVNIQEGHYMIYDNEIATPKIEKCPPGTYQPSNRSSSTMVEICAYDHSDCNGEGEVEWLSGNEITDRICKCDYKRNYVELEYALRASLGLSMGFSKNHDDVQCFYQPCGGTRLQNYSCVDNCPEGMYYLNDSGECVIIKVKSTSEQGNNMSSTVPKSSTIVLIYNTSTLIQPIGEDTKPYVVPLAVCVPLLIFFLIGLGCFVCRRKKKLKEEAPNNIENVTDVEQHLV
ncbi:hypothetical protein CHS0354_031087 [Potamilus streckersoni]|uniref:Uncharacterized protein n=1 Tax=Potamilus streckersoni TaxID=2493646 RepID=A0AAE0VM48_9BIVA|nr:hypothetical protein CHS0354_031087 [Potamilus streckersoni]